ncbi:MAG: cell division protein ZapA [Clostridia bacterium]|nr:cell division protein ZapA [Clostridia bacterium]
MTVKNKVEVRIAGKEYVLVGVESDEYIQKVGLYIDRKMNEVMRTNSRLSTSMAAVLTSINVADDFFKAHENEIQMKKEIKRCHDELERLREENRRLTEENAALNSQNTNMQVELAKREAELTEVRNSLDILTKPSNT